MTITENNIEKALTYLEKLSEEKQERLIDNLLDEQAYLSTFVQQNLDHIFEEGSEIIDFTYNLYYTVLYVFKSKLRDRYEIVDKEALAKVLEKQNFEHHQVELGDFIFTQYVVQDFSQEDFLKAIGLLNVVILCLSQK